MGARADTPTNPAIRRPLLNIDEAAAYLNVPIRWVSEAVRLRKIRCTRIGKHVRFRLEHLDELIDTGEQPVTESTQLTLMPVQPSRRSRL